MAVHVEINPEFNDRSVMVSANDLKRNLERSGNDSAEAWARGFERAGPRVQKAYETAYKGASNAASTLRAEEAKLSDVRNKAEREAEALAAQETKVANVRKNLPNLTATIAAEEQKLKDIRDRHNSTIAELTVRTEAATRAFTNQNSAISDLGRAFKEVEKGASGLSDATSGLDGSIGRFGPAAVAGIAVAANALSGLVGVAASASQALIALPAVVGAAGAAFGTLQLATLGFDDALKAIGDPKKFGEALKGLAPNAQQAALAIQALMPEFEKLKNATQDAFFANAAPQLNALTTELLPMVQQTTTGIATAFNAAFAGVANQLQTPETKAALDNFGQNITKAFDALAPATAPLTKALGDLLSVGSGALPQIAVAASNAATAFSSFITEASNSGELKRMLDGGLNTLEQLVPVAMNFGKAFMSLAPLGEKVLPSVVTALNETANVLPDIVKLASSSGNAFSQWSDALKDVDPILKVINGGLQLINGDIPVLHQSISDLINPLHIIAEIIKGIEWFFNPAGRDQPMRDRAQQLLDDKRAQMAGLPPGGIPGLPGSGPGSGRLPLPPGATYGGLGSSALVPTAGGWTATNPFGSTPSASSARKLPTAPVTPYDSSLPAGFAGLPQTAALLSAESSYMDANTSLAEKKARANQLEKSNVATADEIQKARNDVITAEHTQNEAELRLYDARNKQLQNNTQQMSQIGVALDKDLGISKGLAGIADNLVRFVGSLALAPWEAKMQAISNAPGQAQGGFGLIGILGAQGAFGPQFTAAGQAAASGSSGASALGPSALQPGGAYPGDAALLSNVPSGSYAWGGGDLAKGLTDCSGAVTDLVNIMDTGSTTAGHDASTGNEAQWLTQRGFLPTNTPMPGTFQVGLNAEHTQATLPGGTQFNWGNNTDAANRGVAPNSGGAWMPGFDQHFYRPVGATAAMPGVTTGSAGLPGSTGGATPVFVTNMPGGGLGGGGFPPGSPASGQGAGPAPGPTAATPNAAPSPGAGGNWGFGSAKGTDDVHSAANMNPALNNPPAPPLGIKGPIYGPGYFGQGGQGGPTDPLDERRPIPPGNFNPSMRIDTSTTSVAPPYDPNRIGIHDIENMINLSPNGPVEDQPEGMRVPFNFTGPGIGSGGSPGPNFGSDGASLFPGELPGSSPFAPGGVLGGSPFPGSAPGPFPGGPPNTGNAPGNVGPFPVPGQVQAAAPAPALGHGALLGPGVGPGGGQSWGSPGGSPGTQIGAAVEPAGGTGKGGVGASDSTMALAGMAASALDVMAPGAGQAAQIGMKLANRAIQYGGQVAGIGVQGLMQTFLPTGGSELANNSWASKLIGGLAGAAPALPNMAGKPAAPPAQGQGQPGQPGGGGDTHNNITVNNQRQTEDGTGKDIAWNMQNMYQPAGKP